MTGVETAADVAESTPRATAAHPARARRKAPADLAQRYGLVAAWLVLIGWFAAAEPTFRTSQTAKIIIGSQATLLLVTLAAVLVLLAGEFDLSLGAVVSATTALLVHLNFERGWPFIAALAVVVLVALAIGSVNAVLVLVFNVPSIVATLGMATLVAGLTKGIAGESPIAGASPAFVDFMSQKVLGLPVAIYVAFAACAGLYYVVEHTPWGRHLLFVGRGREVARLAGLRETRYRAGALIGAALLAGAAGIVLVGLTGASSPSAGDGYLLPAYAAAFLGSTTVRPGQFNVWGSVVAVYFLITGVTGLQLLGYTGWVEDAFYGASLLVAVVATQVVVRYRARTPRAVA